MNKNIEINLGIFREPIDVQLEKYGYKLSKFSTKKCEKIIKSWNVLRVHSIATETECDRMAKRIIKQIESDLFEEGEKK